MTTTQNVSTERTNRSEPAKEAARYALDASHSHVGFSVRHMMISNVRGEFTKLSGEVSYDPARPEATQIDVTVDVSSINTREASRDTTLTSADFSAAEKYPNMPCVPKRVKKTVDGLLVTGDLTIHGTTREVALTVEDLTPEHLDPYGNRRVGASARTKIRRSEFGMQWNAALEAGGVLVGDEVAIQ